MKRQKEDRENPGALKQLEGPASSFYFSLFLVEPLSHPHPNDEVRATRLQDFAQLMLGCFEVHHADSDRGLPTDRRLDRKKNTTYGRPAAAIAAAVAATTSHNNTPTLPPKVMNRVLDSEAFSEDVVLENLGTDIHSRIMASGVKIKVMCDIVEAASVNAVSVHSSLFWGTCITWSIRSKAIRTRQSIAKQIILGKGVGLISEVSTVLCIALQTLHRLGYAVPLGNLKLLKSLRKKFVSEQAKEFAVLESINDWFSDKGCDIFQRLPAPPSAYGPLNALEKLPTWIPCGDQDKKQCLDRVLLYGSFSITSRIVGRNQPHTIAKAQIT